jgi:hypothetical protein
MFRIKNLSGKICKKKKKTYFVFNFFFENRTVYETIWKNMKVPDMPQMTILYGACALRAGYVIKAIDTHSVYVILIAIPQQKWLSEGTSVLC